MRFKSSPPKEIILQQDFQSRTLRAQFPNYYKTITALSFHTHQKLKFQNQPNYSNFQNTNILPVILSEFSHVCSHYPIVFNNQQPSTPMAMISVTPNQNSALSNGYWRENSYIPAVVRRYPFIAVEHEKPSEYLLCFDGSAPQLNLENGQALFNGNTPTDFAKKTLSFCVQFAKDADATQEFTQALEEENLLVEREIQLKNPTTGRQILARGFRSIDPDKFKALSDQKYLAWRKKGWIEAVYYILISQNNWPRLAAQSFQDQDFLKAI